MWHECRAIERVYPLDGGSGLFDRPDDETGHAMLDHFRDGGDIPRDHRRAAGHGLDHDETEGLGPVDGKDQRRGASEELALGGVADSPRNSMYGAFSSGSTTSRKYVASAASTFAASLRGTAASLATSIARSGRFSGEMRPRNARYPRCAGE